MHLCNSFLNKEKKEKAKEGHITVPKRSQENLQRQLKGKIMWTLQSLGDQHCRRSHISSHKGSNTCGNWEAVEV